MVADLAPRSRPAGRPSRPASLAGSARLCARLGSCSGSSHSTSDRRWAGKLARNSAQHVSLRMANGQSGGARTSGEFGCRRRRHAVGEADQRPADGGDVEEGAEHDDAGRHRSGIVRSRMRQPVCAAKHSDHSPPAHPREDEEKARPHIGSWTSTSPCSSVTSCTGPSLSICGKISPGSTVRPSPGE